MTKKGPNTLKHRKGAERPKPKAAPTRAAETAKDTADKVREALEPISLPTKTGLKFIITKYLRDKVEPKDLEQAVRLTLQELSGQSDSAGRFLDSIYWFESGCVVEIRDGKLYAKNPEGKEIISGKKIKIVKPEKVVEPEALPAPEPAQAPAAPTQVSAPLAAAAPETVVPAPLPPELITLLTRTKAELQKLRAEFNLYQTQFSGIDHLKKLQQQVTALADALTKLPDSQFQLDEVRLLRMQIAELQVEIAVPESDKKAAEMPSVIKGLETRVQTFKENADTWISEVDLITNTSRVPAEQEIKNTLDKYNKLLLEESDDLRKTIGAIEASPTFNETLRQRIDPLKEQIAIISKSFDEPVKKLQAFLATHKKLPTAQPAARPNNVVVLRPAAASSAVRRPPVNVDDVLQEASWGSKAWKWLRSL
ncbi:hypothetical protein HZC21_00315 [Candidatus Peregrinibacteria bacterium]|nr:hypothetical protein [Candidatus Peregrinibacteria bacterium]